MGPKLLVVCVRKDGFTTVSKHNTEQEAEAALEFVGAHLPDLQVAYLARVAKEVVTRV